MHTIRCRRRMVAIMRLPVITVAQPIADHIFAGRDRLAVDAITQAAPPPPAGSWILVRAAQTPSESAAATLEKITRQPATFPPADRLGAIVGIIETGPVTRRHDTPAWTADQPGHVWRIARALQFTRAIRLIVPCEIQMVTIEIDLPAAARRWMERHHRGRLRADISDKPDQRTRNGKHSIPVAGMPEPRNRTRRRPNT